MASVQLNVQIAAMFGIKTGPIVMIDGVQCMIVHEDGPTACTLQKLGSNRQFRITRDEFQAGLLSGRIRLNVMRPRPRDPNEIDECVRKAADPRHLGTGIWRQYFVQEQNKFDSTEVTKEERREARKTAFERARQDENVPEKFLRRPTFPSEASIYRWMKAYDPTYGAISLIPNWSKSGRRGRQLHEIYERIIADGINDYFRIANRRRNGTLADIVDRALTAHHTYSALEGIEPPSRSTIYRRIRELGGEAIMALETGKNIAHRKFKPVLGSFKVSRPLERVEIDTTKLDRLNVNLTGSTILSRAYLTTALDVATRMVVGFIVTLTHPSSADIRRLIRISILPKDPERLKSMGVKTSWPAMGVWKSAPCDNGNEYVGGQTKKAFAIVGTIVVINPPRTPQHKPYIEIVQKTLTNLGIHEAAGSTMNNPGARGERRPDRDPLSTIDLLEAEITKIICDVYHVRDHRGLGCSPLAKWEELAEIYGVEPPPMDEEFIRLITEESRQRTVSHEGIELNGIKYNSNQLANVHRAAGQRIKLTVHFDPFDLSEIRVETPGTGARFAVPCIDPVYAGLDLKTHQMLKKYSRSKSREVDRIAYIRNRAAIVRYNGAIAGERPSHMLPPGVSKKRLAAMVPTVPVVDQQQHGNTKVQTLTARRLKKTSPRLVRPDKSKDQPVDLTFQPEIISEDDIKE